MAGITSEELVELREKEGIGPIDIHFARLMEELGGEDRILFLASCFVCNQTRMGHVCLNLDDYFFRKRLESEPWGGSFHENWKAALSATKVVGQPGDRKPLILDGQGRLYLYRYHEYQRSLAGFILDKTRQFRKTSQASENVLQEKLDRLFGENPSASAPNHQKTAVCLSFMNTFSVISGGPGTGKTTTVAKLLVLYIESWLERLCPDIAEPQRKGMNIVLCAPTGKAARRLKESLGLALEKLDIRDEVRKRVPGDVLTIHRLLGTVPGSPYFRHHGKNPLNADLVVVDEASMVDLALMSKLVSALSPDTSLVLLGDKDQLASVEAGSVLGDICGHLTENMHSPDVGAVLHRCTGSRVRTVTEPVSATGMENMITILDRSYRFGESSGIGKVAKAANTGDFDSLFHALEGDGSKDTEYETLPDAGQLKEILRAHVAGYYTRLIRCGDVRDAFKIFDEFRILCAVREGAFGVHSLNRMVLDILAEEDWIDRTDVWYPGRPVMVFRNDYNLKLFNGDVGITVGDGGYSRKRHVVFQGQDGQLRSFKPDQLPEHETAFAMTVHKSQGSEFDRVLLVLPERDNPILTRELVYTGVTRARKHVTVMADPEILKQAVMRKHERRSGLRDLLWPGSPSSI